MQYHPSPLKIKFLSRNVGSKSSQAGEKVIKTLFSVQLSGLDKADNLLKCENWPSVKFQSDVSKKKVGNKMLNIVRPMHNFFT